MGVERLPATREVTLDLDTTHLLRMRTPGRRGAFGGYYTPKASGPAHPLLGMISEVPLVAGSGFSPAAPVRTTTRWPSLQELLGRLPSWVRLGLVRADSGFAMNGSWSFGRAEQLPPSWWPAASSPSET